MKRLPSDTPQELLIDLLEELEFIPLAITQASAFMAKRRKTVQSYLDLYRKSDVTKMKLLSYEFSDHGRPGSSMESVAKHGCYHLKRSESRTLERLSYCV